MEVKGKGAHRRVVVDGAKAVKATAMVTPTVQLVTPPLVPERGDSLVKGTAAASTSTIGAGGGAGGGSTLLKATLADKLDRAKGKLSAPPVVDHVAEQVPPQPNLYVSSLGAYAQLAQFIDNTYGNRDGVITVAELQQFVAAYGRDPQQRNGIVGIAMMLGCATVEQGGVIQLANMNNMGITVSISVGGQTTIRTGGGGGVRYEEPRRTTTTNNAQRTNAYDPYQVAHALVRQTTDANPHTVQETIRSLASMPAKVLDILTRRGTKVIVCNRVPDYRPDLRYEKPRGWPPGSTWEKPAGMYDPNRNEIVIANGGSGAKVVGHEVGHALDAAGWTKSREATFVKMYNADYNSLVRNGESYLLQPGEAGLSEAFAESHGWFQTNPSWLRAAYPNLHRYWEWVAQNNYSEVGG